MILKLLITTISLLLIRVTTGLKPTIVTLAVITTAVVNTLVIRTYGSLIRSAVKIYVD